MAGLAGVFSTCIALFKYVQLGRKFGQDYGKCVLRLDVAKALMSRWGASEGIGSELQQQNRISERDFNIAKGLLQQIEDCFEDAEHLHPSFPSILASVLLSLEMHARPLKLELLSTA